jgi:hypothetical protein
MTNKCPSLELVAIALKRRSASASLLLEDAKATAQQALLDMTKDKLAGGDQCVFMVSVRENADEVMRVALAMRVEYFTKA